MVSTGFNGEPIAILSTQEALWLLQFLPRKLTPKLNKDGTHANNILKKCGEVRDEHYRQEDERKSRQLKQQDSGVEDTGQSQQDCCDPTGPG